MKKNPANRPLKYGEETTMIHIRVPKTKAQTIITHIKKYLKKFEVKK